MRSPSSPTCFLPILALLFAIALNGCSVLIGNVKPVEEKSETYGLMDLSQQSQDWTKLDPKAGTATEEDELPTSVAQGTQVSDVAFQSNKTSAVISLNSACRKSHEKPDQTLRKFTDLLFLGISEITLREEKSLTVEEIPALQTTIQGKLNEESMMLRTVVLRQGPCLYDLMYVTRPDKFKIDEDSFSRFVASLRLK